MSLQSYYLMIYTIIFWIYLSARTNGTGIIVCKNFDHIHSELLEIFYSYMQTLLTHKNLKDCIYID